MTDLIKRLRDKPYVNEWGDVTLSTAAQLTEDAADEIERLRIALMEIEASHVPDQSAAYDIPEVDWVRQHVGRLRRIARAALNR